MESRIVYRGIELNILSGSVETDPQHYHSIIRRALFYRYNELKDLREHRYAVFQGLMSLYGNREASLKEGNADLKENAVLAFSTIPYYNTHAKSMSVEEEREYAATLLYRLNKNMPKEILQKEFGKDKD